MRVMMAVFIAAVMTFGIGSSFAGESCAAKKAACSTAKKAECAAKSAECEGKSKEECAAACAEKKAEAGVDGEAELCGCGYAKGSDDCAKACEKS